ncbi:MAG: adenylate/guanylate cyclase domain-containing protein [Rhizomicrobium sp.]
MTAKKTQRRLAAILATDVVGFSRLVGMDEEGTLARLAALRRDLIDSAIAAHDGRIVKTIGDGLLVEFASVVDAVRCATWMQREILARAEGDPADKRILFRMGINLGDIMVDGDDILGDGVNIAARLEGIAQPGSVYLSEDAWRQTRGKLDQEFVDLGERDLKNIAHPLRVYAIPPPGDAGAMGSVTAKPAVAERVSIAVLPFQKPGGGKDDEYFSDGIAEDIVTALSRWRWFFVIARNSSFTFKSRGDSPVHFGRELGVRYVLDGSIRRAENRVRITVRLIDTASAANVWTETFDRDMGSVLALQDEITRHVVAAIEPEMVRSEGDRAVRKNIRDLNAFECCQRGMWHFNKVTDEGFRDALLQFHRAVALDPELSLAYTGLARTLYGSVAYGWSQDPMRDIVAARDAAATAIALDRYDAFSHHALAGALLYLGQHKDALEEAEKTIALNPNFAYGYLRLGQVLIYSGRAKEAIAPIQQSIRHSPYDPQLGGMRAQLALAYYHAGEYASAMHEAQASVNLRNIPALSVLAAGAARGGHPAEARIAFQSWTSRAKTSKNMLHPPYANPADLADLRDGVRLAACA